VHSFAQLHYDRPLRLEDGHRAAPSTASKQGMLRDERTVAEALRDGGYATWMVGKWHLGEWQSHHLPRRARV